MAGGTVNGWRGLTAVSGGFEAAVIESIWRFRHDAVAAFDTEERLSHVGTIIGA